MLSTIVQLILQYIYLSMTDHLHGLCKNCVPKCTQVLNVGKKEDECNRCGEGEPTVIVQEQAHFTVAICTKCYLKEASSPKKSQINKSSQLTFSSKMLYSPLPKGQLLSKGFFSSEGKMLKKIDKYFSKFDNSESVFKDLLKRSLIYAPILWQKLKEKVDKNSSLMYVFVSKSHIFGCYHNEPCKLGQKGFQDSQSGFFCSSRAKIDLQFYKANDQLVTYHNKTLMIGRPPCFEAVFEGGQVKLRCDLAPHFSQWIYQFVTKV